MGNDTEIFQAELLAILHICLFISSHPPSTVAVNICIDSKADILALSATTIRYVTVSLTIAVLKHLSIHRHVTIHRTPAHSGILGNDLADSFANKDSDTVPIRPLPFALYSSSCIINSLESRFKSLHLTRLSTLKPASNFHHSNILSLFSQNLNILSKSEDDT